MTPQTSVPVQPAVSVVSSPALNTSTELSMISNKKWWLGGPACFLSFPALFSLHNCFYIIQFQLLDWKDNQQFKLHQAMQWQCEGR